MGNKAFKGEGNTLGSGGGAARAAGGRGRVAAARRPPRPTSPFWFSHLGSARAGAARGRGRGAAGLNKSQNETVTKRLTLCTGHPNARCPALASTATGVSFSSWPHAAILTGAVVAPERLPTASTALITCAVAALTSLGPGGSG